MRRVLTAVVTTLTASAGWLVAGDAGAVPVLVPRTQHHVKAMITAPVTPGFPIDFVGVVWEEKDHFQHDEATAEVRFRSGTTWTTWRPMGEDGAEVAGQFASGLVSGGDAEAYQVRAIPAGARVSAINTTDGPLVEVARQRRSLASAAPTCRSRADWGADESKRSSTPPSYATPQVITVHHTADDSDSEIERDPAARIRAIYEFHVIDRGLDDIGYQYVVDESGIVYEGRASGAPSLSCLSAGGTGSDFAHEETPAHRAVVGAHVGGWNSANVGVALLGNYETTTPPASQRSAAEQVLGGLSRRHGIDATDTAYPFVNPANGNQKTIPTISGHRDWVATLCPGRNLYDQLPDVRARAASIAAEPPPPTTTSTTTTTTAPTTTMTPTTTTTTTTTTTAPPPPPRRSGYWMVTGDGSFYSFGDAPYLGAATRAGAVDLEPTSSGNGYWIVDSAGRVDAFGDAPSLAGPRLDLQPGEGVTSISSAGSGRGYWLFTTAGRVVPVGGAPFFGDLSGIRLNGPVLDSIPTPTGRGYHLVASDGGIFSFGDALFRGSMGDVPLTAPVQSLVPDSAADGYWLVASDGGIFAFGVPFHGSMGDRTLNQPVTGMVADGSGGYLMVAEDGGVFAFGTARFQGSLGDQPPTSPVVSVATVPA